VVEVLRYAFDLARVEIFARMLVDQKLQVSVNNTDFLEGRGQLFFEPFEKLVLYPVEDEW
jgi:hypothetical protein